MEAEDTELLTLTQHHKLKQQMADPVEELFLQVKMVDQLEQDLERVTKVLLALINQDQMAFIIQMEAVAELRQLLREEAILLMVALVMHLQLQDHR